MIANTIRSLSGVHVLDFENTMYTSRKIKIRLAYIWPSASDLRWAHVYRDRAEAGRMPTMPPPHEPQLRLRPIRPCSIIEYSTATIDCGSGWQMYHDALGECLASCIGKLHGFHVIDCIFLVYLRPWYTNMYTHMYTPTWTCYVCSRLQVST